MTIHDAKANLETEGLYVSSNDTRSLWIAGCVRDMGEGVKLSDDACTLIWDSDHWVAVFPAKGFLTYEVAGSLSELVTIIAMVYAHYRRMSGSFRDAFEQTVPNPEQYLIGCAPAHV